MPRLISRNHPTVGDAHFEDPPDVGNVPITEASTGPSFTCAAANNGEDEIGI
jgi:hypothetical protein